MTTTVHRTLTYNTAPSDLRDRLPEGFLDFLLPLHRRFTPWQFELIDARERLLRASHLGRKPDYCPPSEATSEWRIQIPDWCVDQRNQMTGPADDAEMVVKLMNSGAPGVMLDLEDSTANYWSNTERGIENILHALGGTLTYHDHKRDSNIGIKESSTAIWIRPRGLHISQAGISGAGLISASLFDVARIAFSVEARSLRQPLAFYIPKSESADEAIWWRDLFQAIAEARGWPRTHIRCMALVESHPLAYQMEEFLFNLREHIVGLNLGRWDYMASLIHYNLADPEWVLPDRNTIPHNVPFFQRLRELLANTCHRHGALAIGGMTALFPSRTDPDLNARALAALQADKRNEADCLMDGAWTGHPDQNQIAVEHFPYPNQIEKQHKRADSQPNLRPVPDGIGRKTFAGTREAIRTVIRYRHGVLTGKGASLLDGYMEDLATDRIYRLMIAQRVLHRDRVEILDDAGAPIKHTPELITRLFDLELGRLLSDLSCGANGEAADTLREARSVSEAMILNEEFDPI